MSFFEDLVAINAMPSGLLYIPVNIWLVFICSLAASMIGYLTGRLTAFYEIGKLNGVDEK